VGRNGGFLVSLFECSVQDRVADRETTGYHVVPFAWPGRLGVGAPLEPEAGAQVWVPSVAVDLDSVLSDTKQACKNT